ncbi:MAG: hypothetical protein JNG85_05055 [Spirochaetaceae bacterium]|nr:hypothetical protein [Spirochaetaceae bacterium]
MEVRYLLLAVLVLVDLPAFYLLLRLLFRGAPAAASGAADDSATPEDSPVRSSDARRLPRLRDLLDPAFLKEGGGEMKILLFLLAAALLVLIEYFIILGAFPGLAGARL